MSTVMTNLTEIGQINDLQPGEMKKVLKLGHEILLARDGNTFYAAEDRCRHMNADLSKGKLAGTIVTCPVHGSQYDLKDGHVVRWTTWPGVLLAFDQLRSQKRPLPVYPVTIDNGKILIKL
jgi:3-phenylpropionate/trans-cinnamate dioxygenase ferredoxin subunit